MKEKFAPVFMSFAPREVSNGNINSGINFFLILCHNC
jgi:hypothetical protein